MAVRHSEYELTPGQTYVTPQWVWEILYERFPRFRGAYECCPANSSFDFTKDETVRTYIATNPPYGREAEKIVRHALHLTELAPAIYGKGGSVAMLLPHAWDTAKGRVDLWNYPFLSKIVLTQRIRWENLEQKAAGPSMNHAWYIWDWRSRDSFPRTMWA